MRDLVFRDCERIGTMLKSSKRAVRIEEEPGDRKVKVYFQEEQCDSMTQKRTSKSGNDANTLQIEKAHRQQVIDFNNLSAKLREAGLYSGLENRSSGMFRRRRDLRDMGIMAGLRWLSLQ